MLIQQVALWQGTPATNKAIPTGGLFMDAPEHSMVPELLVVVGDREKWWAFVNKLAKGEELQPDQAAKVATEDAVREELAKLQVM